MHINHLHHRKLFQHSPWRQSIGQRAQPLFQRHLKTVGKKSHNDMRLDPVITLMVDGTDGQIAFEFFEGLLNLRELDVVFPERSGIFTAEIGAQQVVAFTTADLAELFLVQDEGERLCIDGLMLIRQRDGHQAISTPCLFFGRA